MNKQDQAILANLRAFLARSTVKWEERGPANEVEEFLLRLEFGNVTVPAQGTVKFPMQNQPPQAMVEPIQVPEGKKKPGGGKDAKA